MGIDFLDLNFRLEKRFGLKIDYSAWEQLTAGRKPIDLTAGEVCDVVTKTLDALRRRHKAAEAEEARWGRRLEYESKSLKWSEFQGDPWPAVCECIAAALGVPLTQIRRDSWLIRELGMS